MGHVSGSLRRTNDPAGDNGDMYSVLPICALGPRDCATLSLFIFILCPNTDRRNCTTSSVDKPDALGTGYGVGERLKRIGYSQRRTVLWCSELDLYVLTCSKKLTTAKRWIHQIITWSIESRDCDATKEAERNPQDGHGLNEWMFEWMRKTKESIAGKNRSVVVQRGRERLDRHIVTI